MDSSRDSEASRGDHLHDFIGGQGVGGEHSACSDSKEIMVSSTFGFAFSTRLMRPEQQPQVMPVMVK